jgi:hypothetical protein
MLGPASGRLHYIIVAAAVVLLLLALLHSTGTVTMTDKFQHGWTG